MYSSFPIAVHWSSEKLISLKASHLQADDVLATWLKYCSTVSEKNQLCCFCALKKPNLFVLLLVRKCWKLVRSSLVLDRASVAEQWGRTRRNTFCHNGFFVPWTVPHFLAPLYPGSLQHQSHSSHWLYFVPIYFWALSWDFERWRVQVGNHSSEKTSVQLLKEA